MEAKDPCLMQNTGQGRYNADCAVDSGRPTIMGRIFRWVKSIIFCVLLVTGILFWCSKGCQITSMRKYPHAVPPSSVQTIEDFLQWQKEIQSCQEVQVRGITYFHIVGPIAHRTPSGGALYVFDAGGNFVGWSIDSGDVMRHEAIFYPGFWLPEDSSWKEISLTELKERLKVKR